MKFIVDLIKGIFVGIANVIPGVSGGTMAVSFGIYDKLLTAISNILKDFKNSFKTLLPIGIGMVIGVCGFTFLIGWLLANVPFATSMAFTGLILGGIPSMVKEYKTSALRDEKKSNILNLILIILFAALVISMLFFDANESSGVLLAANPKTMIIVFFMGIIAAATMIIPGVSGSLILMILGYYFGIISAVKDFLSALKDMDIKTLLNRTYILAPFALGCLLGILVLAKLIKWLFAKYPTATYSAIFGLILASPFSIFFKVNEEYSLSGTTIGEIIIGCIIFAACILLTVYIANLGSEADNQNQEVK